MARRRFSEAELDALLGTGNVAPVSPGNVKQAPATPASAPVAAPAPPISPLPPAQVASVAPPAAPVPASAPAIASAAAPTPPAAAPSSPVLPAAPGSDVPSGGSRVEMVAVASIRPNPFQPRLEFDEAKLAEMAASIRSKGVLQPVLIRKRGTDVTLVAGERRMRAAKLAGLTEIPAIVVGLTDQELLEVALIENLQRDDLNPVEEARAFEQLVHKFGLTHEEVAKRVGKDRTTVVNTLRLLRLPDPIQGDISARRLSAGHARSLLSLDSEEQTISLWREIHERSLSVRQSEERAKEMKGSSGTRRIIRKRAGDSREPRQEIQDLETRLAEELGTRVRLRIVSAVSGKIEISYSSLSELERVCAKLGLSNVDF